METYSVSLFFEEKSQSYVANLIRQIAEITGNFYVTDNNIPPHITVGMFKVMNENQASLIRERFLNILTNFKKLEINISGFDLFRNKLLFLKFDKKGEYDIKKINNQVSSVLEDFIPACNGFYKRDVFYPHIAIASALSNIQIKKAMCYLEKEKFKSITINRISLAVKRPYKIIL